MENTFVPITKPYIRATLSKNNTRVLELLMFYETRKKHQKSITVLSCVIYTIVSNYLCIDYIACESKTLCELPVGTGGGFKHRNKSYDKILGIGIPDVLMNLISCHVFMKNNDSVVKLKCPKRMLEKYFFKGFNLCECNNNNLEKLPNEVKDKMNEEDIENSDKVMSCTTTITSNPNTLNKLAVNKSCHSSYIQR